MKTMEQLLALHGEDFVREAYLNILGREVDEKGLAHYRKQLGAGAGKASVVFALAESPEGRQRLAQPMVRDPAEVVAALAAASDQAFVEGAYVRLLGREADPGGLANYLALAAPAGGRERVARDLFNSDEGRDWRRRAEQFRAELLEIATFEKGARQLGGWWKRHERTMRRIGQLESTLDRGLRQIGGRLDQTGRRPQPGGLDGAPIVAAAPAVRQQGAAGPRVPLSPEASRLHGRLVRLARAWAGGER